MGTDTFEERVKKCKRTLAGAVPKGPAFLFWADFTLHSDRLGPHKGMAQRWLRHRRNKRPWAAQFPKITWKTIYKLSHLVTVHFCTVFEIN